MSRDPLRRAGETLRARLGQGVDDPGALGRAASAPGFAQMMTEAVYGGVWARPGLALEDRMVCALAVLGLRAPSPQLESLVTAALDLGLPARSVLEVFVQCGLYGGFVTTESACAQAREVFDGRGITVPDEPERTESMDWLADSGRRVMHALHAERAGAGYAAPGNAITGALYETAIRYGYGDLWSRPGLAMRQRLLCALAAFTALGLHTQLAKFMQAALGNGFTVDEIVEVVIQTAPYGGFPRALDALALLDGITRDAGADGG